MRRAPRLDGTHVAVREALRATGWFIFDTAGVAAGFPDLIAARGGRLELLEVKDGRKPPSKRALSDDERTVHRDFAAAGITIRIVESVEQAMRL
jgi:hypothetical protein